MFQGKNARLLSLYFYRLGKTYDCTFSMILISHFLHKDLRLRAEISKKGNTEKELHIQISNSCKSKFVQHKSKFRNIIETKGERGKKQINIVAPTGILHVQKLPPYLNIYS